MEDHSRSDSRREGRSRVGVVGTPRLAAELQAALRPLGEDLIVENLGLETAAGPSAARPDLLVVQHSAIDPAAAGELAAAGLPVLLVLDGPVADPARTAGGVRHWLTLPASPAVLLSVCRQLLARPEEPRRDPTPDLDDVYDEARAAAAEALARAREGIPPEMDAVRLLAERLHTALLRGDRLLNRCLEPHPVPDLATHSVNVGILCGRLASGMAWSTERTVDAILAGLVHDVGMACLPDDPGAKPGPLSPEERAELHRHPTLGAQLLEALPPRWSWLSRAVLEEHERMEGQGYPRGLKGEAIDPLARVLAVADVFEALCHPRTYRSPYTALEALETVAGLSGSWLDPGMVAALVNEVSAFPRESWVQLSTGEIAQVVSTNPENLLRPRVRVRWDADWTTVDPPVDLDLADHPRVQVSRALLSTELPLT